jgi:hypothetical protein
MVIEFTQVYGMGTNVSETNACLSDNTTLDIFFSQQDLKQHHGRPIQVHRLEYVTYHMAHNHTMAKTTTATEKQVNLNTTDIQTHISRHADNLANRVEYM